MRLTHAILTRYALQMDGRPLPSIKWLAHRRRVFEQYTLPSVARQTCPDFAWLVFVDPRMTSVIDACEEWRKVCPQLTPVPTTEGWDNFNATMRDAVLAQCARDTTHIITTRLDNDDVIARDFVAIVQAQCEGLPVRRFVNFDVGENYDIQSGRRYEHVHPCNMFVSCIEPVDDFQGVLTWAHNTIEQIAHVIRPPQERRWTHLVHPWNVWPRGRTA